MAEALATAFASVYTSHAVSDSDVGNHQSVHTSMSPVDMQLCDVLHILQSLDVHSAAGGDSIHPMLLKSCASQLAYPLLKIFCLSLEESKFPEAWEVSQITLIFKKNSIYVPLNYQPVYLNSVPCKCL